MNSLSIFTLKALSRLYAKAFGDYQLPPLQREENPDKAAEMIYDLLASEKPCMIARFGANELNAVINYLGVNSNKHSILNYLRRKQTEWWWNKSIMYCMQNNAGFFPATPENMQRFGKMMIEDAKEVDLLGSWLKKEFFLDEYLHKVDKIQLMYLDPFWSERPWTRILEGKKILIVHPFADSIQSQYRKREFLFKKEKTLPTFKSIQTIKAVQSLGGQNNNFQDWFEALSYMKSEIDKCDFDICLIGCGAYGFPLAAHVKRLGKKAIHMGGSLQLLFGIMGNRWDHDKPHYENGVYIYYAGLANEHWIRPSLSDRPSNHALVENSCYW